MNVTEELLKFISENLVAQGVNVSQDTSFESLGLDSFSLIEIILFIERKFGIALPDKELNKENLYSVKTLATCVEKYRN